VRAEVRFACHRQFLSPVHEWWIERERISPPTNRLSITIRHVPVATSLLPKLEWVQAGTFGSYSVERNDVDVSVKERFFGAQSSLAEAARSRTTACFGFDFARLAYRKGAVKYAR
jgi:hypothetical protein